MCFTSRFDVTIFGAKCLVLESLWPFLLPKVLWSSWENPVHALLTPYKYRKEAV